MKRFARLYQAIDRTTRTGEKVGALKAYFAEAPPEDAAWALHVLTGRRLIRALNTRLLRQWAAEEAGVPLWMVDECFDSVGDLSETIALLIPHDPPGGCDWPLHELVETKLRPLAQMTEAEQKAAVMEVWRRCGRTERFLFHKLISQSFRVGVARTLVVRALAEAAGVDPAIMQHRVMGRWQPTAEDFGRLVSGEGGGQDPGRPYPFYLASPLESPPETLGDLTDWQAEWKWDGIRAQLIHRNGQVMLWSRGEELITEGFPELRGLGQLLPDGTVIDGEVLAWERDAALPAGGHPLPFGDLQRRINRKNVQPMLFADVPVVFMAYDVLEHGGEDQRARPLSERRALLASLCSGECADEHLVLSPVVGAASWGEVETLQQEARQRGVEGFMFKRLASPYGAGRERGHWWKWKVDPFSVDAVLIYAQRGNGKRAAIYSDYTFGVWPREPGEGELVPFAKAYSGLTDEEIGRVDRFVREHTLGRHGPVRIVQPKLVFELHFEGIQASDRHRSGIALRFPRMARWRHDKKPVDADTLGQLKALLQQQRR